MKRNVKYYSFLIPLTSLKPVLLFLSKCMKLAEKFSVRDAIVGAHEDAVSPRTSASSVSPCGRTSQTPAGSSSHAAL